MNFSCLVVIFMVTLVADLINVVSGGDGFPSIDTLSIPGLPPASVLAINRIQALGNSLISGIYFLHREHINVQGHRYAFLSAFIGSALGMMLIQFIELEPLKKPFPILIITAAIYSIFAPSLSKPKRKQQVSLLPFSLISGGCTNFYNGFLGAGVGSFYTLNYILLRGCGIDRVQIHSNLINLVSNITPILFFIFGGKMTQSLGPVTSAGQSLGARLGTTVALTRGKKVIQPMIVIVSICISIRMLLGMY